MRIGIVTPAPPRSRHGNRATAVRWKRILRELGHRVEICERFDGQNWDLLVALHARKSATSVKQFVRARPDRPVVVALTGTDLYLDFARGNPAVMGSITAATRLVTLQSEAAAALPSNLRSKVRTIYQSVEPFAANELSTRSEAKPRRHFDVFVVGHLRAVKDPFRAAMAVRKLPATSRIRVLHYGRALSDSMRRRAEKESCDNDRYQWQGEITHGRLMRALRERAALLVHTSKVEGGPHAISEAVVAGVPVLATDIPGSTGLLGKRYPGLFPVGDTGALRELLRRAERDAKFYQRLRRDCARAAKLFDPARERHSWQKLLGELS